ncbi:MAG: galactokinase [Chthoniobacteraceae bacterium]
MQKFSAFAPGRVELLGNHTDYNEGVVLSAAIGYGVTMTGSVLPEAVAKVASATLDRRSEVSLNALIPSETEEWANYVFGVAKGLRDEGYQIGGFDVDVASDLPLGAGLSSSAALEVATGTFLKKAYQLEISPLALAKVCKRAENEFVGVNCGLLDQVSSVFGKSQHAIFLDCRAETVTNVPFPAGVELLITHSGVKHALVGGEYNERREQCFDAAKRLGAVALRDVSMEQLVAAKESLPELSYRRALHVVGECERVTHGVEFLRHGDVKGFGTLMFDSHESSRVNFENSTPELDALVAIALEEPKVLGCRLTGGGFGGATVSLVMSDAVEEITQSYIFKYRERTGHECQVYRCRIADGAH